MDALRLKHLIKQLKENTIEHLDLREVKSDQIQELQDAMAENTSLTRLRYVDNISNEVASRLAVMLEKNKGLTTLNLWNCKISDEGAKFLAAALEKNQTLQALFLNNNEITSVGAKYLADAIVKNENLLTLSLSNNKIGDDGVEALAAALAQNTNTKLRYLGVTSNQIGIKGAKALAAALEKNGTLRELYCVSNQIGDEGAKALAAAQFPFNKNLVYFCLDYNGGIDQQTIKVLYDLMKFKSEYLKNSASALLAFSGAPINSAARRFKQADGDHAVARGVARFLGGPTVMKGPAWLKDLAPRKKDKPGEPP